MAKGGSSGGTGRGGNSKGGNAKSRRSGYSSGGGANNSPAVYTVKNGHLYEDDFELPFN